MLLLCASFVLAGLLAEGLVLAVMGEQPKFPRHVVEAPWGLRYNEPARSHPHKSADMTAWFRINHRGMRDDQDYPYQKPAGTKRIISLGDSYTIGYKIFADQTFSSVIQSKCAKREHRARCLTAVFPDSAMPKECLYLERELLKYEPDLVIVSFCGNDFGGQYPQQPVRAGE